MGLPYFDRAAVITIGSWYYGKALEPMRGNPAPPFSMLCGTHQRSKNAKIGVLLDILRRSLILEKRVLFECQSSRFSKIGGAFHQETKINIGNIHECGLF